MAEAKREEEKVVSIDEKLRRTATMDSSYLLDDPASADPPAAGESSLAAEFQKLKAEKEELLQTMVRRQADFENFRKRTERDRNEESRRGVERLVLDLIPVLDAFDRALQAHDDPRSKNIARGSRSSASSCGMPSQSMACCRSRRREKFSTRTSTRRLSGWNPKNIRTALWSPYFRMVICLTGASCVRRLFEWPCIPTQGENSTNNEN